MRVQEIILDVSELEPPEPLERAVEAIAKLGTGQYLRMNHRRRPELLYPILRERGFSSETRERADQQYEILIWREEDKIVESAVANQD